MKMKLLLYIWRMQGVLWILCVKIGNCLIYFPNHCSNCTCDSKALNVCFTLPQCHYVVRWPWFVPVDTPDAQYLIPTCLFNIFISCSAHVHCCISAYPTYLRICASVHIQHVCSIYLFDAPLMSIAAFLNKLHTTNHSNHYIWANLQFPSAPVINEKVVCLFWRTVELISLVFHMDSTWNSRLETRYFMNWVELCCKKIWKKIFQSWVELCRHGAAAQHHLHEPAYEWGQGDCLTFCVCLSVCLFVWILSACLIAWFLVCMFS